MSSNDQDWNKNILKLVATILVLLPLLLATTSYVRAAETGAGKESQVRPSPRTNSSSSSKESADYSGPIKNRGGIDGSANKSSQMD